MPSRLMACWTSRAVNACGPQALTVKIHPNLTVDPASPHQYSRRRVIARIAGLGHAPRCG